jgi:hypothetical protein
MRRKKAITAHTDLVNGTTEGKTTIKPLVKVEILPSSLQAFQVQD